jgi:adenosylcobyric acid synthase
VLPGSKNTLGDLGWLGSTGLADWILARHGSGARVVGICGGFQMLGLRVEDPAGVESGLGSMEGLGLIPATTTLTAEKRTRVVRATTAGGVRFGGYEIHLGVTAIDPSVPASPFAVLDDGSTDGYRGGGVIGTYLHGAFESAEVCAEVFGVAMPVLAGKSVHYERLGLWFERHGRHLDRLGFD